MIDYKLSFRKFHSIIDKNYINRTFKYYQTWIKSIIMMSNIYPQSLEHRMQSRKSLSTVSICNSFLKLDTNAFVKIHVIYTW